MKSPDAASRICTRVRRADSSRTGDRDCLLTDSFIGYIVPIFTTVLLNRTSARTGLIPQSRRRSCTQLPILSASTIGPQRKLGSSKSCHMFRPAWVCYRVLGGTLRKPGPRPDRVRLPTGRPRLCRLPQGCAGCTRSDTGPRKHRGVRGSGPRITLEPTPREEFATAPVSGLRKSTPIQLADV